MEVLPYNLPPNHAIMESSRDFVAAYNVVDHPERPERSDVDHYLLQAVMNLTVDRSIETWSIKMGQDEHPDTYTVWSTYFPREERAATVNGLRIANAEVMFRSDNRQEGRRRLSWFYYASYDLYVQGDGMATLKDEWYYSGPGRRYVSKAVPVGDNEATNLMRLLRTYDGYAAAQRAA